MDASTRDVFSNKRWLYDKEKEEVRVLNMYCSNFDALISAWLANLPAAEVTAPIGLSLYEAFCESSPELEELAAQYPRACLQGFIDACFTSSKQPGDELFAYKSDLWNAFSGPVFRCDMLVDTTCDDQCDWERLKKVPYVFSSEKDLSLIHI